MAYVWIFGGEAVRTASYFLNKVNIKTKKLSPLEN